MTSKYSKIPWNHTLDIHLLQCVQQKGAHIPKHGYSGDVWNEVNEMFFNEDLTASFKDSCYKSGNYRKLRDRYDSIRRKTENLPTWIEFKSQGGIANEDNPNKLFNIMRQLEMEIENKDEIIKSKSTENSFRNEIEPYVLDYRIRETKRQRFEQAISCILSLSSSGTHSTSDRSDVFYKLAGAYLKERRKNSIDERESERLMTLWLKDAGNDGIKSVITELDIDNNSKVLEAIDKFTIDLLLNIYCSPGGKFELKNYLNISKELNISPIVGFQLHRIFDNIKLKATKFEISDIEG